MFELPQFFLLPHFSASYYKGYLSPSEQEEGASTAAFLDISHDVELPESENTGQSVQSEDRLAPESSERIDEIEYLMFEVEKAKTVQGLVHIKACSNGKYWVRESADSQLIVAEANEPEEDQSKWSCTLFMAFFWGVDDDSNSKTMQLFHVSQHHKGKVILNNEFQLAVLDPESTPVGHVCSVESDTKHSTMEPEQTFVTADFNVVDASSTVRLPEYVAFKGPNGRYLASETNFLGKTRLFFETSDIGETGVAQRISYSSSDDFKMMHIIDQGTGAHWTTNPHKRRVTVGPQEMATLFYPIPIKVRNCIALKCLSTNKFAKGTFNHRGVMYLTSDSPTISNHAFLTVEEPVFEREITDATYNLDKSKIYKSNTRNIDEYTDTRSNHTDVEQKGTFQVEYKVSKTMSWNRSTTVNLGIKATLSVGIPHIGMAGVEIPYEKSCTWAWGEQQTEEKTVVYSQDIMIPPRKRVTLKVLLKKERCEVPFSCKVRDRMTWGELREYEVTDGMYKGSNMFHFDTKIIDEDL